MTHGPIPIVLCGRAAVIGSKSLAQVIEFITSTEEGCVALPQILRGQGHLVSSSNELGTHNYSVEPQAIMFGAGYEDEDVEKLRDACKGEGIKRVPWLRAKKIEDVTTEKIEPGPAYAQAVLGRAKDCLNKLNAEAKLGSNDETVWF
ncbi:hypothetical protein BT69DRAFT_1316167 [Atractiella rhizophila]|nr:hypothetical protein BT69DRAFT_1316167 [Atractiella rhizophila]